MADDFENIILEPLPPQDRSTPFGRAVLGLATFAGRALNATGGLLLALAGGANLGVSLLALLLNRASPGRGTPFLVLVGLSWVCWLVLAFLRWRINSAGPGETIGQGWGQSSGAVEPPTPTTEAPGSPQAGAAEPFFPSSAGYTGDSPLSARTTAGGMGAAESVERVRRASLEFAMRRRTPFPRIEAAQRSIRTLIGGDEQPAWVRYDLRPLVFMFVAVAASIPIMMVLAVITLIGVLGSTAPF